MQLPTSRSSPFSTKSTCDTPAPIVAYTGNDYASRPVLASAPGSPIVAAWDLVLDGVSGTSCVARVFSGGAWGAADTLSTDCTAGTLRAAAGGGAAVVATNGSTAMTATRKRTAGTTWAAVGTATDDLDPSHKSLRLGSGGHGIEIAHPSGVVSVALIDPAGTTFTPLPDNPAAGAIDQTTGVVDAVGDGFAIWIDLAKNTISGRTFRGGQWKGDVAELTPGGIPYELDAALLPNGDAYVVWARNDGSPGAHGATIHFDSGATKTMWGTVDDLMTGNPSGAHRVFAAADGELTVLWAQGDGSGTAKLTARRKIGGGAWGAPATLGKTSQRFAASIDASGHVTAVTNDSAGAIFHYRIAKGATAWSPVVRVDAKSGVGTAGLYDPALAIDPATGNPVVAWTAGNSIVFSVCR